MFLRGNSSENPTRRELLESVWRRPVLAVATLTTMSISAVATADHAWVVGALLRSLEGDLGPQAPPGVLACPSPSVTQIVWLLVLLGLVRALSETFRANLSAKLPLSVAPEIGGKVLAHVLCLEPSTLFH